MSMSEALLQARKYEIEQCETKKNNKFVTMSEFKTKN